ncbi:hypothetical protein KM043_008726 [Ampulex compressa]|nr:hypothetical protein KM043_008726 [Ampulex compressa]
MSRCERADINTRHRVVFPKDRKNPEEERPAAWRMVRIANGRSAVRKERVGRRIGGAYRGWPAEKAGFDKPGSPWRSAGSGRPAFFRVYRGLESAAPDGKEHPRWKSSASSSGVVASVMRSVGDLIYVAVFQISCDIERGTVPESRRPVPG